MGNSGSDVPVETQMLLLEAKAESFANKETREVSNDTPFYILFLPVLDGEFRSSLQGNSANELEFCMESGNLTIEIQQPPVRFILKKAWRLMSILYVWG